MTGMSSCNNPHVSQIKIESIKNTQYSDRKGRSEQLRGEAHRAQRSGKMKPGTRTDWPDGMSCVCTKQMKNGSPDLRPGTLTETGVLRYCSARGTEKRDPASRGTDAHEACSAADGLSVVNAMKEPAALRNLVGGKAKKGAVR
jgi:hypothetical protein